MPGFALGEVHRTEWRIRREGRVWVARRFGIAQVTSSNWFTVMWYVTGDPFYRSNDGRWRYP